MAWESIVNTWTARRNDPAGITISSRCLCINKAGQRLMHDWDGYTVMIDRERGMVGFKNANGNHPYFSPKSCAMKLWVKAIGLKPGRYPFVDENGMLVFKGVFDSPNQSG